MDNVSPNTLIERINAKYFLRKSAAHLRKATNAIQLSGASNAYSLLSTAELLDAFIQDEINKLEDEHPRVPEGVQK
jgi:hypothetical protein